MKRVLVRALVLCLVVLAGYGAVVHGLSYRVLGYRPDPPSLDPAHLAAIQDRLPSASGTAAPPAALRRFAVAETARRLTFAVKRNALTDPNQILDGRQAHCRMYAYVVAATYNQLVKPRTRQAACRVAYGHMYLYGVNLHPYVGGTFFQDHDFCVFADEQGAYAADATLYDYFRVGRIRLRN
ncbi:hypothetical protein [Hymenobacter arizonensis]|uniref:Transglutaminase-like superfamily protein n=1 Tax=Hymenobacter arizonensis TaxID=1227077 RepID=A0A1I6BEE6_HYMAR|nr:hypothetical protein [Hymenobacter arizonensis]SFQ79313.1 hypothetical protein SAMN04515668_4426 [Hymenobacter arizonensis]